MNNRISKLYIISGSSGVGKGTLIKEFLKENDRIKLSVSSTTRKPRPTEVHGINYFFITKEEFERSIQNKNFLEWAIYNDNYYGTDKEYVEKTLASGFDLILEIEVQGASQIKKKMPEAISIFIEPPSLTELENRLRGRNSEDEQTIQKRMKIVKDEMEQSKFFDYRIVNDNIEKAVKELKEIFKC